MTNPTTMAGEKAGNLKNCRGSIGWRARASTNRNAAPPRMPAANRRTVSGAVQEDAPPSITPPVMAQSEMTASAWPPRSMAPVPCPVSSSQAPGNPDSGEADGYVDEEDAAPAEALDHQSAQHRAGGQGDAPCRRPKPDGVGARPVVTSACVVQQGQGGGHERRGADALHRSRGHQQRRSGSNSAGERGENEQRESENEGAARADAVTDCAGGQHQRGECEGIGVHDPLEGGHTDAETGTDASEADVDDRDIELDENEAQAGRDGSEPQAAHVGYVHVVHERQDAAAAC